MRSHDAPAVTHGTQFLTDPGIPSKPCLVQVAPVFSLTFFSLMTGILYVTRKNRQKEQVVDKGGVAPNFFVWTLFSVTLHTHMSNAYHQPSTVYEASQSYQATVLVWRALEVN